MKFPWQSKVFLEHPWIMLMFLACLALLGSLITWVRQLKAKRSDHEENIEIEK